MLYNCLEWYKWVLTNLYHDGQLYNTLIPPLHESPAVGLQTCSCISRLSGSVELTLRYTTPDIRCRHRRHECDGGTLTLCVWRTAGSEELEFRECMRPGLESCLMPLMTEYAGMRPHEILDKVLNTHLRETCGYADKLYTVKISVYLQLFWACGPTLHYSIDLRIANVYRTGSVKVWNTRHKISVNIRIF